MTEAIYDAPIPGSSLTKEVGASALKNPPRYTTVDEAIEFYVKQMSTKEFGNKLADTLEMGVPVTSLANIIQMHSVMEGRHTLDVSMMLLPILMEMIAYIAESRNVDYDMGTDEDKDIPSEEAILASINRSKMKAPETVQEQVPEEVTMEEDPSVGLMARSI